jgi:Ni,Fe-hydrogenase III small subunit
MFKTVLTRLRQGHRTMKYPHGAAPAMPARFAGRPVLDGLRPIEPACAAVCPTGALSAGADGRGGSLDMGKCLFCRACQTCSGSAVRFTGDYRLAGARKADLIVRAAGPSGPAAAGASVPHVRNDLAARLLGRSLKLRQVSAGGCNACEADTNVLNTIAWDLGRFGIQFVASPRHADGLLVTGPVPRNMRLALEKTYAAVPAPKIVIAVGACAIAGGPYTGHEEVCGGADAVVPVDLYIPGCPPHPMTILDGLLRFLGKTGD